jgi:hypothetical protein
VYNAATSRNGAPQVAKAGRVGAWFASRRANCAMSSGRGLESDLESDIQTATDRGLVTRFQLRVRQERRLMAANQGCGASAIYLTKSRRWAAAGRRIPPSAARKIDCGGCAKCQLTSRNGLEKRSLIDYIAGKADTRGRLRYCAASWGHREVVRQGAMCDGCVGGGICKTADAGAFIRTQHRGAQLSLTLPCCDSGLDLWAKTARWAPGCAEGDCRRWLQRCAVPAGCME